MVIGANRPKERYRPPHRSVRAAPDCRALSIRLDAPVFTSRRASAHCLQRTGSGRRHEKIGSEPPRVNRFESNAIGCLHNEVLQVNRPTKLCLFAGALAGLTSCGGSNQPAATPSISGAPVEAVMASGPESGPPTKIVAVPGGSGAAVCAFSQWQGVLQSGRIQFGRRWFHRSGVWGQLRNRRRRSGQRGRRYAVLGRIGVLQS